MGKHRISRASMGLTLALVMLVAGPVASASADAEVRLVNTAAGSDPVGLEVGSAAAGGKAEFGQVTPYVNVPSGEVRIALTGADVSSTETLDDGARYTVVALKRGSGDALALKLFEDGSARGGRARLRVIHAAPELGSPDIRLGERTIAEDLGFRSATPYIGVEPGSYALAVARPGADDAIFERRVALSAGSARTAVIAGSGGAEPRVIVTTDDTVTPAAAPETGFGGLADRHGPRWLFVALAALAGAALGAGFQLARPRR